MLLQIFKLHLIVNSELEVDPPTAAVTVELLDITGILMDMQDYLDKLVEKVQAL